jgi:hypothetical protein
MKSKAMLMILLFVTITITACASANFTPRVEPLGLYQDTTNMDRQANEMSWAAAKEIQVFVGTFPEGITYENGKLITAPDSQYDILAKVYTNIDSVNYPLWFSSYPEDEAWRNGYCNCQVPLTWLTLGIWTFVSPFSYPCFGIDTNNTADISARKMRVMNTLKKAAKAAGGEILVVTSLGQITTINAQTGAKMGTLDMTGAEGYALKRKKPVAPNKIL